MEQDGMGSRAMGAYVRALRKKRRKSQEWLAEMVDMKQPYISAMETGKNPDPSAHHLGLIVRTLNGSIEQAINALLGGDSRIDEKSARHLAEMWVEQLDRPPEPEDIELQQIVMKLRRHPDKWKQWIDYGRYIASLDGTA